MLEPELALNLLSPGLDAALVAVSDGVRSLEGAGSAVVARDPWRPLTEAEAEALVTTDPTPCARSVSVLDLGQDTLDFGRRTLLPLLDPDAGAAVDRSGALRTFQSAVLGLLYERHGLLPETVGAADLVVQRPGLASTAFNKGTGHYMGLHIDSHQRLALGERGGAMTLCAVNLGRAERHLHYVPRSVAGIADALAADGQELPASALALKDRFFAAHPDEPVLRLTLAPGQAYLCVTQNTIHDGATGAHTDVAFLTMSRFADEPPRLADRPPEP